MGSLPNKIKLTFSSDKNNKGETEEGKTFIYDQILDLYDTNGNAVWVQHSAKNQVDIACIRLPVDSLSKYNVTKINDVAKHEDMKIELGNEVFIIGYPLGFSHFAKTPIWKRGSIASEPHVETVESKNKIIVDATTRAGMSGSPVIMRSKTHYISESDEIICQKNATRFIGVYASRPGLKENSEKISERHELGYVYKSGLILEIIINGIQGSKYGEKP